MSRWFFFVWLSTAGCSLALSGPEPTTAAHPIPRCDTGKGLVLLDGLGVAINGSIAFALASGGNDTQSYALIPAAIGVAYLAAALHGSSVVDKCRDAMDAAVGPEPAHVAVEQAKAETRQVVKAATLKPAPAPEPEPEPEPDVTPPAETWGSFWKVVP